MRSPSERSRPSRIRQLRFATPHVRVFACALKITARRPPPGTRDRAVTLSRWIRFYNVRRPHQALDNRTPMEVFRGLHVVAREAA
ncbi:MAG: transposase [Gemmatimonadales bacterium]|nr:transposase [Gemmatimonadales bacterium]